MSESVLVFAMLSFTELAPKLLNIPNVKYLLRCFHRTRWRDISPSSDTVEEATRTPQQSRYH